MSRRPKRLSRDNLDYMSKKIINKVIRNRSDNIEIKPFKVDLTKFSKLENVNLTAWGSEHGESFTLDGNTHSVKLQKVVTAYANHEKLLANPKDAKKYISYRTSYRLTARKFDAVELKEVA